ncbi:hypothetical protein Q2T42_06505 [Leptolyngbya boryana CZ1]|uniref:Uncharacterized protein n=1 Tax=Leptolyngbya boryana CZ1 TaxID=3060204 RepID=A0AA96X8G5_LEPBY|nr:hypothetical protein [Leptolyngbya boryana]WNZ47480.1 hypothetical protein Q2T42_06505 [Leptolyngbya boryana CZ1]
MLTLAENDLPKLSENRVPKLHENHLPKFMQFCKYLKRRFRWHLPKTLEELRQWMTQKLQALSPETIASITGRASILEALSVAGI